MRKRQSLIRNITGRIWLGIILMFALVCCLLFITLRISQQETKREAENLMSIYLQQMETRLEGVERTLSSVLEDNGDLVQLSDEDETIRVYASIRLKNQLASILRTENSVEFTAIASDPYQMLVAEGGSVELQEREALMKYAEFSASSAEMMTGSWQTVTAEGTVWICRKAERRGLAVCLFVRADTLLSIIQPDQRADTRWTLWEKDQLLAATASEEIQGNWIQLRESFQSAPFTLVYNQSWLVVLERLRTDAMILLLFILILWILMIQMRRYIYRELSQPMKKLEEDMYAIRQGEYDRRLQSDSNAEEFIELTDTFNQLLDEIIQLRIQEYEKQLALQEADQKYIRMQLRPHFFLNAMTTVSALSEKGKNTEIQIYIDALSKNIRYMFSAGLHTVTIGEEIQHVQNYLKMQELKYPDCVFSFIDLPDELREWRIPQMMIHTLIENEYKYAVSRDAMLMIAIQVSRENHAGMDMLKIQVEDDGAGYSEDVINSVNQGQASQENGKRVGLASLHRLMELMYEQENLFLLSNRDPHGAMATIWVPPCPVHER